MRVHLWAGAFAAAASALPSRPAGSSSAPVVPSSSTVPSSTAMSSTASSSSSTSSATSEPDKYNYICESGGQTEDNWKDLDMGYFLNTTSLMWCDDKSKCPYGPWKLDFVHSLASLLPDKSQFNCVVGKDDCNIPTDSSWCTRKNDAQAWFALNACRNFHDHVESILDAIAYGQRNYATKQVSFVQKFTEHDISGESSAGAIATVLAGFFAIAAALLGPLAPMAEAVVGAAAGGAISGGLTIGAGSASAIPSNVAEVLQQEIDNIGNMGDVFAHGFNSTWMAIQDMGAQAINTVPSGYDMETGYTFSSDPTGAPAILNDGAFAKPIDWTDIKYDNLNMAQMTTSAAISYLWQKNDQVYIVKVSEPILGIAPCDADINDLYNVCDDDGKTAYFFIPFGEDDKDKGWKMPTGIDNIDDENLDLVQMAKAAKHTQDKYGYGHEWDPKSAADSLLEGKFPPYNMMVNLPVCDLEAMDWGMYDNWEQGCHDGCYFKNLFLTTCRKIPDTDDNFPYSD